MLTTFALDFVVDVSHHLNVTVKYLEPYRSDSQSESETRLLPNTLEEFIFV